jgi:hypothetical protein
MHTWFWWGSLKEIDAIDRGIWEDNVKMGPKNRTEGYELVLSGLV